MSTDTISSQYSNNLHYALSADRDDVLNKIRESYLIPHDHLGNEQIYFCGNSLGLQPKSCSTAIQKVMDTWATKGVEGWFDGDDAWVNSLQYSTKILSNIIQGLPSELAIANSLSVNLHLLLLSFYQPSAERYKIIIEADAFPSDQYIAKSQIRYKGYDPKDSLVIIRPHKRGKAITYREIKDCLKIHGHEACLILISGVNYSTGQAFDIPSITNLGHQYGCYVGLDLAHAIGNIPLNLHDDQVDFAAWCHYKYLNAGPGSIGGMFVHQKHHNSDLPKLHGWWGNKSESKFKMDPDFDGEIGAQSWVMSTPSQLSIAALGASLALFDQVGMSALRDKSIKLTGYLEYLINDLLEHQVEILTPPDPKHRGCQLSLKIDMNGRQIYRSLIEHQVICDWREPNIIRLSPCPMYNTYVEVYQAVQILAAIFKTKKRPR